MSTARIAVVGAGIAGLAAARTLVAAGRDVGVFDKARGPGGRMSTRRRGERAYDHGAQYFTCRDAAFAVQVDDWQRRGLVRPWDEPILTFAAGDRRETKPADPRYVGVPRMSALTRDLVEGLAFEPECRVERVSGGAGGWRLDFESSAGGERPGSDAFDAVVIAVPAPQAAPLLREHPDFARQAAGVVMLPCLALLVSFERSPAPELGGAFVEDSPLGWVARNGSKPGRPPAESWVLHATPGWSAAWLEAPAEAVAPALLRALAEALGNELPAVVERSAHRWRYARTERPLGPACLWDASAGLGVCGDWLHGARVEDAYTSGRALAQAMLAGADTEV